MARLLIPLLLLVTFVAGRRSGAPKADLIHKRCGINHISHWPENLKDAELSWPRNQQNNVDGPIYRLITEEDMREVEPETVYNITLSSLDPEMAIVRFLIYVESEDEAKCGYGKLRSLSDESEHLSYSCPRFLVERSPYDRDTAGLPGYRSIPFSWQSPKCGRAQISVMVLNHADELFSVDDDFYHGLSLVSAVKGEEEKMLGDDPAVANQVEETSGDLAKNPKNKAGLKSKIKNAKGKTKCCRAGIQSRSQDCIKASPGQELLSRVGNHFGLSEDMCLEVFQFCCTEPKRMKHFRKQNRKLWRKKKQRKARRQRRKNRENEKQ